tara:strand:+ start:689 stop:838 length:150 start_codon:yes stop_codon:yes gene_type:complete
MKKNLIIFLGWLLLVVLWNYGYQEASPLEDVMAAIVLSLLSMAAHSKLT